MLAPLDERMLRSLVVYNDDVENQTISDPRIAFGQNSVSGGLQYIFDRFRLFWAVLDTPGANFSNEWPDPPCWAIEFREHPWKRLSLRPDPVDKTSCRVFEDEKYIKTYKMLGCPDQWVELVRWLWKYGNDRLMGLEAMDARRKARTNHTNPAFILPARRSKPRRKSKPPPPFPAQRTSHVLRRTGLRSHQASRNKSRDRSSHLSTMTLAENEDATQIREPVPEKTSPGNDILQETGVEKGRAAED